MKITKVSTGEEFRLRDWQQATPHMAYSEYGGLGDIVSYFWYLDTYWIEFQRFDGRYTVPVDSVTILSPAF